MPTTRAPSLDLLRALRQTVKPNCIARSSSQCPFQRQFHRATARNLQPTPILTADDQPSSAEPSAYKPSNPSSPTNPAQKHNPFAPRSHDRGPTSKEDTQTDFGLMDIYANIAAPATSIDACTSDGFHLDNGMKITGYSGLLVAGGEAWNWRPWLALSPSASPSSSPQTNSSEISALLDARRGILTIPKQSLGLLAILHPKPDLLIVGTGSRLWMLAPETKRYLMEELGVRVDVMDTGNASAAYNLLAKERGVEGGAGVGGAFLPIGWKGPEGRRR